MKICVLAVLLCCAPMCMYSASPYVSKVWVADMGDGTYRNPVLYADYSDPDVCSAEGGYYMTASSFNCVPALPILHSTDLVNWRIAGYAIHRLEPDSVFDSVQHGAGVWAPSIRYHNNRFYIFYGDPDYGIYMLWSHSADSGWSKPTLVKKGKGLIDPCPLWDDDGQVYLVHAFAGSRAGIKSMLAVCRMDASASRTISEDVIVYDGHGIDETIEGPKLYKRDGYYYILAPAGGVAMGWQVALRSANIYGPYERRIVLEQGNTAVNGPHQGAWVHTVMGEDWFLHFQDMGAYGRVVHLQPMQWKDDFPVIGSADKGNTAGNPVMRHAKPKATGMQTAITPEETDSCRRKTLGLQWQWHANPKAWWAVMRPQNKPCMRLYTVYTEGIRSLWNSGNLLLQKFPAPAFIAATHLTFSPNPNITGERAGLVVMGLDYAAVYLEKEKDGIVLKYAVCVRADKGGTEIVKVSIPLKQTDVYLRMKVTGNAKCVFEYSINGAAYSVIGEPFIAKEGKWIGAKVGLYALRPQRSNDGGWVDVDGFIIE